MDKIEELQKEVKSNPVAIDHRKVGDHSSQRDLVETFEINFNELRLEFNQFLAKWM